MKGESFFALIAGAAAGLTLGLLFAPEKGEDTRRKVKTAAADGWEDLVDATEEGWDRAKESFEDVKEGAGSASRRMRARARLAHRDLKDLKATLSEEASDLKESAREKILAQLEKLERSLERDVEDIDDQDNLEEA